MATVNSMDPRPIPTYALDEFRQLVEHEPDVLTRHPCVVRGFVGQWDASRRWLDLEYLADKFGNLTAHAGAPQFTTHKDTRMCRVSTDFRTYLKYVENPERVAELFEGKWSKGDLNLYHELNLPLYCGNLRIVTHSREDVFDDLAPLVPAPLEYFNDDIPYYYQTGNHVWLYVSLAGALTPLHQDNNSVCAYLGQLRGQKQATLYSPEDSKHYFDPSVGFFDPLNPNEHEFPSWREAQPFTATLNPGELLIWGPRWAHHVVTLSKSITVSFDFVSLLNLDAYSRSKEWRRELGRFAKKNAKLIRSRIFDAGVVEALESAEHEEIGRCVMVSVLRAALESDLSQRSRIVRERMLRVLVDADWAMSADADTLVSKTRRASA